MKAFFLLAILFLAFVLFASSNVSQADLNPYANQNSGLVPPAVDTGVTSDTSSNVVNIQDNTTAQTNYAVPVTGSCSNPYTVQSGDILSGIAQICNTTVAAIRLANPQITNANLIYPGQQLVIPNGSSAANPQAQVPVTGALEDKNTTSAPQITVQPGAQSQAVIPQTGSGPRMAANSMVQVKALNFPANTPVSIAVGPQSAGYNVVAASITDANGTVTTNITLPTAQNVNLPYVVVVATSTSQTVTAMSQPFYIVNP